jgi:hypothetical protein
LGTEDLISSSRDLIIQCDPTPGGDILFSSRGSAAIPLMDAGNISLDSGVSIFDAINIALGTVGGGENLAATLAIGNSTGGNHIILTSPDAIIGAGNSFISIVGTGANSQRFGPFTLAAGTDSLAVGNSASSAGNFSTALGRNASSGGLNSLAVGRGASALSSGGVAIGMNSVVQTGVQPTAIGFASTAQATNSIAIGPSSNITSGAHTDSIALGANTTVTGPSQFVVGSVTAPILDLYLNGEFGAAAGDVTIHSANAAVASGNDGADLELEAGLGDGAGADGDLVFTARNASTPFNEVGQESLSTTSFGAISIIGALNELVGIASAGVGTLAQTLIAGNTTGMNNIVFSDGGRDLLWGTDGSGNIGSGPTSLDNRPGSVWVKDLIQVGDNTVTITGDGNITAGAGTNELSFDASTGIFIVTTGVGNRIQWSPSVGTFVVEEDDNSATFLACQNLNAGAAATAQVQCNADGGSMFMAARSIAGGDNGVIGTASNLSGGLDIRVDAAASIRLQTDVAGSGGVRWEITSDGHFIGGSDNSYDIGASGATRPRTGYFGTSAVAPRFEGLAADSTGTPSFTWTTDTDTGMYRPTANQIGFACNGFAAGPTITQTQTFMGQDLNFNLGGDHIVMSGANSQIRGSTTLVGAPPFAFFADTDTGLWNPGADQLSLVTAGISRWEGNASGHLVSGGGLDNIYDIGTAGATRPRRIYVGTSIVVPSITLDGDLLWATDGSGNIGSGPTSLDNRPANVWVRDQLQVGDNTVTLTSGGDITAGDGANEMFWSASGGSLLVTSPATFGIDVQGPRLLSRS